VAIPITIARDCHISVLRVDKRIARVAAGLLTH